MSGIVLSVVAPVYNEAGAVEELARRCVAAARTLEVPFEIILADDASTDATATLLARLDAEGLVRHLRLDTNRGQFGATQAGLAATRGDTVIVLDGDLQDPPEVIPALFEALAGAGEATDVVFAAKRRRDDPAWLRAGSAGYHVLQRLLGGVRAPRGIGSYCAMRGTLARRVGALPQQRSNLSAVLLALGARASAVGYDKAARYDGRSRVGLVGLVQEALSSLVLSGAAERVVWLCVAVVAWLALGEVVTIPVGRVPLVVAFVVVLVDGAFVLVRRRRRMLGLASDGARP